MQTVSRTNRLVKYMALAILTVFIFTLSACGSDDLDYDDFKGNHLPSWQYVLDREEDQYLVYYYGVNCSHCKTIKSEILAFASENDAGLKVYFIDSADVSIEDYAQYPIVDPMTGEEVPGTPTIMVIKDGKVEAMEVGPTIIKDLLKQIEEGSYGIIE